jgi:GTP-binding protein HflX
VLADFLIHVLDAGSTQVLEFYQTTAQVLRELGAADKRVLIVLNKMDLVDAQRLAWLRGQFPDAVALSVHSGEGMADLHEALHRLLADRVVRLHLSLPLTRMDLVAFLHEQGRVLSEDYEKGTAEIQCVLPKRFESRFLEYALKA